MTPESIGTVVAYLTILTGGAILFGLWQNSFYAGAFMLSFLIVMSPGRAMIK